jgi:large conductance mechanosensitive channel
MKSFFKEFKAFALRGNAIDLAIGVVIGAAFTAITSSLVTNIITPPLSLLTRGINFADLAFAVPTTDAEIQYGLFIQAVITFAITAFALFLLVKLINHLQRIARKEQEEGTAPASQKSPELIVLEEIRDSLKKNPS